MDCSLASDDWLIDVPGWYDEVDQPSRLKPNRVMSMLFWMYGVSWPCWFGSTAIR